MEHTGIYNAHVLQVLMKHDSAIWLEAAMCIKTSLGFTRGKNDKVDSYRIARYAYLHQDEMRPGGAPLWAPKREVVKQLAHLTTLRKRLMKTKIALIQPLMETKSFLGKAAFQVEKSVTDPVIRATERQLKQVERQRGRPAIEALIKADEQLYQLFDLITSVEAIGPVTAGHILVVTNEFKNFTCPKKFACYAGTAAATVAPFENSSGSSIRGKSQVSPWANKESKRLLHMAAMSAINMQGDHRKVAEGKNKMAVLNAVRNKLIKRIFAVVNRGTKYEKNYTPMLA
jgi:transposase